MWDIMKAEFKNDKTIDVMGMGAALMDFLIEVDENTLLEMDLRKGEMHLVDEKKAKTILENVHSKEMKIERVPGGSAANTLKGVALLGGNVIFCGKIGEDDNGQMYEQSLQGLGVDTKLGTHNSVTGHALTFITPDSQRTFSVHLGAAIHIVKEDVLEEDIAKSKILHLEGYQLEGSTQEVVLHAIELAKKHGTLISLDLADPGVIRRNKDFLAMIVKEYVDIVYLNETEAQEFAEVGVGEEEKALDKIAELVSIAVVKIGKDGSMIKHDGERIKIMPVAVDTVDTTGAGDSYAAGLLYGIAHGWKLEDAGKLGSLFASKVVAQQGVGMKEIIGEEMKKLILSQ